MINNKLSDDDDDFMSEINITPMVDVMLLLMLIFLITAPILTNNINVNLPETSAHQTQRSENKITKIFITGNNEIYLEKQKLSNLNTLFTKILAHNQQNVEYRIFADKTTAYDKIAKILSFLQKNNITNIGLVTEVN